MTKPNRIRGRRLQVIRSAHFHAHPLCVMCQAAGRTRAATELDHIVALTNGGADAEGNRQGLCQACHEAKTRSDLGQRARVTTGADGWPVETDAVSPIQKARRLA